MRHLTEKEQDLYLLILSGKSNKEIATQLGITVRTVRFHVSNILAKHKATNRLELLARQLGGTSSALAMPNHSFNGGPGGH
jgi:DNA-binding CsgD family transcriptional regulator